MSKRRRIAISGIALLVGAAGSVFLLRGKIASAFARGSLDGRGIVCEPLTLTLAASFDRATLEPTTCSFREGRVASVVVEEEVEVALDGFSVTSIRAPSLTLDMRERVSRGAIDAMAAARSGALPERLRRPIDALARLAERGNVPELDVNALTIRHEDRVSMEVSGLHLSPTIDGVLIEAAVARPPTRSRGPLTINARVVGVNGTATAQSVRLRGTLEVGGRLGQLADSRSFPFRVDATEIGTGDADYRFRIERPENEGLQRLLERVGQRVNMMQERAETARERVDMARERVDMARERVDMARERVGMARERVGMARDRVGMAREPAEEGP